MQSRIILFITLLFTVFINFTAFGETYVLIVDVNTMKIPFMELGIKLEKNITYIENPLFHMDQWDFQNSKPCFTMPIPRCGTVITNNLRKVIFLSV